MLFRPPPTVINSLKLKNKNVVQLPLIHLPKFLFEDKHDSNMVSTSARGNELIKVMDKFDEILDHFFAGNGLY